MSEIRSSQRRRQVPQRDSSVTQVRVELPAGVASTATGPDDQPTVISSRRPGAEATPPPLLAPLEAGTLLEGEQLGQFELRQFVGGGGMGVVFRGWDTTLNREVAVKVLSRDQSADEETLRRFRNEAQSAARLDHGNIARVFYVGQDRGLHYIVFEFIEGVNLRDLVDRHGPLPVDEALDYALQVAEALDHASQRDVIHRDIKPSNVLITAEGHAKLVDMGLARLHQVEHTNDDLTASGVTLGTFDYISPEQARDPRSADVRSDLYSLGCSLYFMLVGQPPFPRGTVLQKLLQHQGEAPPNPRTLRGDLPSEVVKMIGKLLAKTPSQRYQTPADLIEDLQALRGRFVEPATAVDPGLSLPSRFSSRRWRKHLPWAVPLLVLVAVTVSLDLYWSQLDRTAVLEIPAPEKSSQPKPPDVSKPRPTEGKSTAPPAPNTNKATSENKTTSKVGIGTLQIQGAKEPSTTLKSQNDGKKPTVPADAPRAIATHTPADGLLVVGDTSSGAQFSTLRAACAAAKNGDVVELRYNGRREESPFGIAEIKLTIRAADGFTPVVRFVPTESDLVESNRAMITISDGSLTLMNVAFEFAVPRELSAEDWSLMEIERPELVRLERTTLTIENSADGGGAFHPRTAFFAVAATTRPESNSNPSTTGKAPMAIELQNCMARGEATFLRVAGGESVSVTWDNGLLATTERLLQTEGLATGPSRSRVEFDARHLTAEVRRGLAWLDFRTHGMGGLSADLRLAGSIIRVGPGAPMIEQFDPAVATDSEGTLTWSGDRNFYEGVDTFWRRSDAPESDTGHQVTFDGWQSYWGQARENLGYLNAVIWQQPQNGRPVSQHTLADYALSSSSVNNPARDSASDGLDAGCLTKENQLPEFPALLAD